MAEIRTDQCAVCGDSVTFDLDDDDIPVCSCCMEVICEKHTVWGLPCPHDAKDHDGPAEATEGQAGSPEAR
jgi:hypothetical protein